MTTDAISFTQLAGLIEGQDRTMARLIEQTVSDINRAEQKIRDNLSFLLSTAERVKLALDSGAGLNSLGEFQRTPMEIDMAIAARAQGWTTLGRLIGDEAANKLARREA
jgi:hypothetical protein